MRPPVVIGRPATGHRRGMIRRIASSVARLPPIAAVRRAAYERTFARNRTRNLFRGVYDSFAAAAASAPSSRPVGYDHPGMTRIYQERLVEMRVSEYPALFWLERALRDGARSIVDLGGNLGNKYYAFARLIEYPPDLRWIVHDVPAVIADGREHARANDPSGQLGFADTASSADGCDLLLALGSLQYLDYTLAELLQRLPRRPRFVLVNQTPLHPRLSFFTLNSIGTAFCPYRITALPEFVSAVEAQGYREVDRWFSEEKQVDIPFAREHSLDGYTGMFFTSAGSGTHGLK